jgi:hypothetical protein
MVGKPVVKDTRIPVELVLGHLAANPDLDELFAAYPHLAIEAPPRVSSSHVRLFWAMSTSITPFFNVFTAA